MKRLSWSIAAFVLTTVSLFGQYPPPAGPPPNGNQGVPPQYQDQPGQPVARLALLQGEASIVKSGSGAEEPARVNSPLLAGDALSLGPGARAEVQIDYANFLRVDGNTEFRLAAFDNGRVQIQLSRGRVTWRLLRESALDVEISTPVAAAHPFSLAAVRVEVEPDGSSRAIVRHGQIDVSSARGGEAVHEGSMISVSGDSQNAHTEITYATPPDAWDAWNEDRDAYLNRAQSYRYISSDIYGAEDLDANGRWGYDAEYGNVWTPNVPAGWAPYRDGQWSWDPFYGWVWVDAASWGWAPYHYGSWYFRTGYGWSWFPGPRYGRYWWRPAMVSFFGFGVNVGWVPLAPFEVFHPWYGRGFRPFVGVGFGFSGGLAVVGAYRNAPFATGIAVADIQRGVFNSRFAVSRTQLAQATVVRGALPVGPLPAVRAAGAVQANSFAGRSFVSRQSPSAFARPAGPAPAPNSWQRFGQTPSFQRAMPAVGLPNRPALGPGPMAPARPMPAFNGGPAAPQARPAAGPPARGGGAPARGAARSGSHR